MATYWELLKHPNWQKKRLLILDRDGFACQNCGDGEKTLHIHHTYYEKGLKPWEYPDVSLRTLCEDCHKNAQDWMANMQRVLGITENYDLENVCGYALALWMLNNPDSPVSIVSFGMAIGVACLFRTNAPFVVECLVDGAITGAELTRLVALHTTTGRY